MKKIVIERAGGYDRLELRAGLRLPEPRVDEVVIEARAAGVNYADCIVRMGLYQSAKDFNGWPITPGFELAGRVARVGSGVKDLKEGDEVFGVTRFGGYSSHVATERRLVFRRPRELSAEQAAGFPAVFLTAYYPLFEMLRVRAGSRVLVHSAGGGVGGALVQLARLAGCEVVGVVGASHKRQAVAELGAQVVIDKSAEPLWQRARAAAPRGFDIVLDANGVSTLRESYRALAPAGKLVIYGFHSMLPKTGGHPSYLKLAWDWLRTPRFNPLNLTNENKSVLAFNLSYLFDRTDVLHDAMTAMLGWLGEGKLRPLRVTEYPIERVADAHRALESGQTVGKLVLTF